MTFSDFNLNKELIDAVGAMGFESPFPIQREAIPAIRTGRDVLACAETGSGKTAAFLLPLMDRFLGMRRGGTRALVLAPTRELAAQTAEHFTALAGRSGLTCAAVYGGVGMKPQENAFRRGVDLIVATPGRLLDHMQHSYARLDSLGFLVLDEADRMLDMGFLPDIRRILGRLPAKRQTMLFSATLPKPIVELSKDFLTDPVKLNIDRAPRAAAGISHSVYMVPGTLKSDLLLALITDTLSGSALVFTRTKHRADRLARFLERNNISCERIHGNRSQAQRTAALSGFKKGKFKILVATDITARGIDVEELGSVVNFDVPHMPEDYVHRSGRTARALATGDSLCLVSPEEERDFSAIERHLGMRLPRKTVTGFDYTRVSTEQKDQRPERPAGGYGHGGARGTRDSGRGEHRSRFGERATAPGAGRTGYGAEGPRRPGAAGNTRRPAENRGDHAYSFRRG